MTAVVPSTRVSAPGVSSCWCLRLCTLTKSVHNLHTNELNTAQRSQNEPRLTFDVARSFREWLTFVFVETRACRRAQDEGEHAGGLALLVPASRGACRPAQDEGMLVPPPTVP